METSKSQDSLHLHMPFGLSIDKTGTLLVVPDTSYEAVIELDKIELEPLGWNELTYSVGILSMDENPFTEDLGDCTLVAETEDNVLDFRIDDGELTSEQLVLTYAQNKVSEHAENIKTYEESLAPLKWRIRGLLGLSAISGVTTTGLLIASKTNSEISDSALLVPFTLLSMVTFLGSAMTASEEKDSQRRYKKRLSEVTESKAHIEQFLNHANEHGLVLARSEEQK